MPPPSAPPMPAKTLATARISTAPVSLPAKISTVENVITVKPSHATAVRPPFEKGLRSAMAAPMTITRPYARLLTTVNSPSSLWVYEANRFTCSQTRVAASPRNDGRKVPPMRAIIWLVRAAALVCGIDPRFFFWG